MPASARIRSLSNCLPACGSTTRPVDLITHSSGVSPLGSGFISSYLFRAHKGPEWPVVIIFQAESSKSVRKVGHQFFDVATNLVQAIDHVVDQFAYRPP